VIRAAAAVALGLACVALPLQALAQFGQGEGTRAYTRAAPDLRFPTTATTYRGGPNIRNAIFRPEGAGPFPALVFFHTCGGVDVARQDYWTLEALQRRYVVLVLDSLGPRGVATLCDVNPTTGKNGVTLLRGAKDALDALAHLRTLPIVDPARVALAGFSWGANAGLLASSASYAGTLAPASGRFAAVASFYPFCGANLQRDVDRPLLVLMGGDDDETPPATCLSTLEFLGKNGAPVAWRVYPGATHAWDNTREIVKQTFRGQTVRYRPNPAVVRESTDDLFTFLDRHLGQAAR